MKRFIGCLALAGAVSLQAGCSTINPYTGEKQTSKAGMGAGIGAVTRDNSPANRVGKAASSRVYEFVRKKPVAGRDMRIPDP